MALQAYNRGLYDWLILAGQWQKPTTAPLKDKGNDSDSDAESQPGKSRKRKRSSLDTLMLKNVTCGVAVDPPESAAGASDLLLSRHAAFSQSGCNGSNRWHAGAHGAVPSS